MGNRRFRYVFVVAALAAAFSGKVPAAEEKNETVDAVFQDEPAARALYEQMVRAMRGARTLSYTAKHAFSRQDAIYGICKYRIWLKKPNYFRVETLNPDGSAQGKLVGDGDHLWLFWSGDRPRGEYEEDESYEKTRKNMYITKKTPLGRHSIGHEVAWIGGGTIVDPSTFHGYTDSLHPYLDGVRGMGTEDVSGEACDEIEVSFMKHQRSWYLWLSQKDHLPRKMKEIVRVSDDLVILESWFDLVIDGEIPDDKFVWTPPEGWRPWERPDPETQLLKPGTPAPDFELTAGDGSKIKLSDHRDKVVWLYIWRAG